MKEKQQLLIYSLFIVTIMVLAYLGYIPNDKLRVIPYYDLIGHFILYGLWGYFFALAFPRPVVTIGSVRIQAGILVITIIAIIEEFVQRLVPVREFSFFDMFWGIAGIAIACIVVNKTTAAIEERV
jgi:VanZ family protein